MAPLKLESEIEPGSDRVSSVNTRTSSDLSDKEISSKFKDFSELVTYRKEKKLILVF
jgi:hypothetical protein